MSGCGGNCTCGAEVTEDVLDVRLIPHSVRKASVLGATDAVEPGSSLVLLAPHDPLPMLAALEQRSPGAFTVAYDERGPQTWKIRLTRLPD